VASYNTGYKILDPADLLHHLMPYFCTFVSHDSFEVIDWRWARSDVGC